VGWPQIVFGVVLILVLLFTAILYTVRQMVALRRLRAAEEMSLDERDYSRKRARRRLLMSLLLFVLGVMLAAALLYLEDPAHRLAEERAAMREQGVEAPPLNPEQKLFASRYLSFWIVFLLILMVVIFLAASDYWATRRYALNQHRKISDDRRAMIEREIARVRQERNGYH
jgi:hypothetical protein